jgi:hypothetical protein
MFPEVSIRPYFAPINADTNAKPSDSHYEQSQIPSLCQQKQFERQDIVT